MKQTSFSDAEVANEEWITRRELFMPEIEAAQP